MSTCPSCNVEGVPGALFCGSCGSKLEGIAEHPPDALVGQTLNGTYVLQKRIGAGGMGEVYRAIHNKLDVPVAVKLIKRSLLEDATVVHRFKREARAASRLRHPNVVGVTDFGETPDGTLFMVMEFVTGKCLTKVLSDEGPLPESRAIHIGEQILSALAEAHANQLLHRDLKPENVMLEPRRDTPDFVKVLDFGIAKVLTLGASPSTLTQAGLVCGTPGYMSPEQLRGDERLDARSDLFAVGVVLYEMLTLALPFDVQSPMEMLHKHLSERIPPPSERGGRPVNAALESLIMRAMALAPEDRPPSADAMRAELIASGSPGAARGRSPETGPRIATEVLPPRRRGPRLAPTTPAPPEVKRGPRPGSATSRRIGPDVPGRAPPPQRTNVPLRTDTPRPPSTPATATAAVPARFDPGVVKQIEERLTALLGPAAPRLTRKVSRQALTLSEFCHELSRFLPSRDEQRAFLAWTSRELHVTPTSAPPRAATPATPAASWAPAVLESVTRDLAVYVGPLARVLVRRASGRARDVRELYALLAAAIPSEAEREAFRRGAPPDARFD